MTIILDPTADPRDLADLDAVRRLLQTPDDIHKQDDLLRDLITEASVMLQRELGRQFVNETGVAKTFGYNGRGLVDLLPHDVRTVTAVTFTASDGTTATLTAGQWALRPASNTDGVYHSLNITRYTTARRCGQTVTVTGDWGFDEVPADVSRGVKITVKTWLREGATFTPEGDVIRFERVGRIPQDVLDGLDHYRPVLL